MSRSKRRPAQSRPAAPAAPVMQTARETAQEGPVTARKRPDETRVELADKMELIGRIFEIDGMTLLLDKYEKGMTTVKFNAVTIQVSALLLRTDRDLSDRLIAMSLEEPIETVRGMEDADYALALRNAIIADVMGFFASSQPSAGGK